MRAHDFKMITKSQRSFLYQSVYATSFTILTGGLFLSGLAAFMGANDTLMSYLSVITNVCGIFVLLFASLLERFLSVKKLTIGLTLLSKLVTISVILIPLLVAKPYQIYVFVPVIFAAFTLQSLATISLNNWMVHHMPTDNRGRYISIRQTITQIVTVILALLASRFVDSASTPYAGFAVLFTVALIMAIVEVTTLLRIEDVAVPVQNTDRTPFTETIRSSIRNKPYVRYLAFIFMFYFLLSVSDSFTIVFMMQYLELPYFTMTMLLTIITLPQIVLLRFWGNLSDRYGNKLALAASIWFFAGQTLFLFLANGDNWFVCLPLSFMFAAIANSGFVISVFNRRYEIIPERGRMTYDSIFTAIVGLAFIAGPFVGGMLRDFIFSAPALHGAMPFSEIRFLYAISTIGIIALQAVQLIFLRKHKVAGNQHLHG